MPRDYFGTTRPLRDVKHEIADHSEYHMTEWQNYSSRHMRSWADDGSILGVDRSVCICIYIGYSVLVLSRPWCTAAWITCTSRYPWWTQRLVTLKVGALYRWLEPCMTTLIAWFMGPTWGPSGADRTQVGPMLALWTLLSGYIAQSRYNTVCSLPHTHNPLSWDIFALLALCEENLHTAGEFPSQRASKAEMLTCWTNSGDAGDLSRHYAHVTSL